MDMILIGGFLFVVAFIALWIWVSKSHELLQHQIAQLEKEKPAALSMIRQCDDKREAAEARLRKDFQDDGVRYHNRLAAVEATLERAEQAPGRVDSAVTPGGRLEPDRGLRDLLGAYQTQINSMRRQMEDVTVSGRVPSSTPEVPPPEGASFVSRALTPEEHDLEIDNDASAAT